MDTSKAVIPTVDSESNLNRYFQEIRKFPMLEVAEEYKLARNWQEHGDLEAAHKLVTSHLRLVARIAMGYRGYGLPVSDLIAEGSIGMIQAVKRFDPDRGFRLATYGMWWIRAAIQEYILRSWSLVKMGTTSAQKKLFFNLKRIKGRIEALNDGDLSPDQVKYISEELSVPEVDVVQMNRRLSGSDASLNAPLSGDGLGGESGGEWQDWLTDESEGQEAEVAEREEVSLRRSLLMEAMKDLNPREQDILQRRRLSEPAETLEQLSKTYNISRERVRQIENRAFLKLQKSIKTQIVDMNM